MASDIFQLFYITSFIVAATVCFAGLIGIRSLDHPDVRYGLASLLVLSGVWSVLTALQLAIVSPAFQRWIHVGALIVGISTVFAWLVFASAYAGRQYHRNRLLQASAIGIFLAIISVKLTNPIHGQYFTSSVATEPFRHTAFSYRAPHWFVTGFSYTAAAVGFLWLFESFDQRGSQPFALYVLVLVTGAPILPYALSGFSEWVLSINYEPLGVAVFAVGVLFYARTEFEHHSSPGNAALADSLSDGGIILDDSNIVINYNDRATEILGVERIPRVPIGEIDPDLARLARGDTKRVTYEVDGYDRTYELGRSAVSDSLIASDIITLKDVTRATRLEQLMGLHREISESLVSTTDPWELIRAVPKTFAQIDAYDLVWLYPVADGGVDGVATVSLTRDESLGHSSEEYPGIAAGEATAYARWTAANAEQREPVLGAATGQTATHVRVDDGGTAWERQAADHGITGCLAVHMEVPGEQSYVLGVYTTAPNGFDTPERNVIEEVSQRIPEAIETIEAHDEALLYKEAIKHAGTAITITDDDGGIQYVNPEFESLTGYTETEAIGETPSILSSGEMSDQHYEQLWATIRSGEVYEEQFVNKTKAGDRYIAQETISPVTGEDGEPKAFVAIQFDITDKLVREQRLSVLNRVLRHNLRSTVNIINAHATLLEDRIDTTEQGSEILTSIETIRDQTSQLLGQSETAREIEQILALDGTGREVTAVETLAEYAQTTASELGGNCTIDLDSDLDECTVDAELELIVEELVENAVVHSDGQPSTADVSVSFVKDANDLILTVEDDGPGMSDQELVVVEKGEEDPLRHGSGLGLWMVNWLSISRGGSVTATTDESGTTIQVSVPLRGRPDEQDARYPA
ncbi:MAG: PAS domain S-box protein [Halovenus sp.]